MDDLAKYIATGVVSLIVGLLHTEKTSPNGEFVVCVNTLGRREFFTLQLLSYATLPTVQNIRCKDGQGQFIQIQLQRQYPRWIYYLLALLLVVGAGFTAYWIIAAALHLSKKIGVL